ncbi:hypothetical protein H5410_006564 [Solanum commersonii]|uniref:Uncharacterized protein n=1 Tax=Solanum commersonii TaxID=4109 RepID=A0A9J6AAV9_SOLCO|nr:hypothetical protein H5410_006564 [Solanum commersonii]
MIQRVGFFRPSSISPALASPRRTGYLFLISTVMVKLLLGLRGCIVTNAFTSGNTEADHMLEKLPEKYANVDSLALFTGSDAEIATLEGLGTPQIGNEKSVESDLVRFCKDISMQTKFPTSVLTDTKESNSVKEKKSLDNAALFDKSSQRDASGTLAPFTKQAPVLSNTHIRITEIVYPIATWVSLVIPLVGREDMMYVVTNSLGSGPPTWKTDLGTFTVGMADLFLDEYFLENVSTISTSVLHFVGLFIAAENGKSIRGFNDQHILSQFPFIPTANFIMLIVTVPISAVDLCVWDPGIDFGFMALTSYIKRTWRNYYCWDQTSVLHLRCITALVGMVQVWGKSVKEIIQVLVERFGGRRTLTTIAQYFEVNNCSIDKSMVRSTIFMMFRVLLDLFLILSVALVKFSASHYLAVLPTFWSIMEIFHLIKKTNDKEEWNEIKDIAASIWHLCYKI